MNNGVYYFSGSSGFYINNVVSGCTTPYTGGTPTGLTNFGKTKTTLLYPFVSNQSGFDTMITVSNTSDPGSGAPSGSCTINYFGSVSSGNTSIAPDHTGVLQAGTTYTYILSSSLWAQTFQGYIIAECNFPRARGWGVLANAGAPVFAASIAAEVLP